MHGVLEIPLKGLSLVLELAGGGSLRAVLSDAATHPSIPWEVRTAWLRGMAEVCVHTEGDQHCSSFAKTDSDCRYNSTCLCFSPKQSQGLKLLHGLRPQAVIHRDLKAVRKKRPFY